MNFSIADKDPLGHESPALVVGCFQEELTAPFVAQLDVALGGLLGTLHQRGEFTGKLNRTIIIHTLGKIGAERVLFVGLGSREEFTSERMRQAAGTAVQAMRSAGIKKASSVLHLAAGEGDQWLRSAVEGHLLGGYSFDSYKTKPADNGAVEEITLLTPDASRESDRAHRRRDHHCMRGRRARPGTC